MKSLYGKTMILALSISILPFVNPTSLAFAAGTPPNGGGRTELNLTVANVSLLQPGPDASEKSESSATESNDPSTSTVFTDTAPTSHPTTSAETISSSGTNGTESTTSSDASEPSKEPTSPNTSDTSSVPPWSPPVGNEDAALRVWAIVLIGILLTAAAVLTLIYFIHQYSKRRRAADRHMLLSSVSQEGFFAGSESDAKYL